MKYTKEYMACDSILEDAKFFFSRLYVVFSSASSLISIEYSNNRQSVLLLILLGCNRVSKTEKW